jgi:hypothetical protein
MAAARAAAGIVWLLLLPGPAIGGESARGAAFREASLTPAEIAAIEKGDVVAKVIDTDDRSEVLSVAAVRVRATPDRVLAWFRGVEDWRRQPWVVQTGRLGPRPGPRDLDAMTLDPADVRDLARCRVGDCEVRFERDAIEQFRTRIDWSSPTAAAAASALARQILASYAAEYVAHGDAALIEYVNNDDPVYIAAGFRRILVRSAFLHDTAPDLAAYLASYPDHRPADVENFLYWTKEKFWRMNVLSLNHSTIVDRRTAGERVIIAATKQLYATHYYEASLSTTVFVEDASGSYLATINRTRADIRPSGFTWIERLVLNHLVRGRLQAQMRLLKREIERVSSPAAISSRAVGDRVESPGPQNNLRTAWFLCAPLGETPSGPHRCPAATQGTVVAQRARVHALSDDSGIAEAARARS